MIVFLFAINAIANNSVYIWSKTFNLNSNDKIISFLNQQSISTILISVSKNTNFDKLKHFIKNTKKKDIRVEFLIGNNSWIFFNRRFEIYQKLKFLSRFDNPYIHLDIEPQAIKKLKNSKKKYLKMYIKILKYIHTSFPKYKISISIPTFYPLLYVQKMNKYVDKIYLMAYGYKKISQLQKRVERYKSLKSKIVVAFDYKDFTKNKLKNDIDFLYDMGYKDIAFTPPANLTISVQLK